MATPPLDTTGRGERRLGPILAVWALIWTVTIVGMRLTLLAPEVCPPVTASEVREAALASATWISANQADDGRYLYELTRTDDGLVESDDYNLVRHAGTTMSLYQLVEAHGPEETEAQLAAADLGLAWMLERQVGDGTVAAVAEPGQRAKLGTAALLTVGLVHRRQATGDPVHDDLLRQLGDLMVGQQREDGSLLSFWDPRTGERVPEITSLYATGEALWALALLHNEFPGQGWDDPAWLTLDYMATQRDEDEDVWPRPWADQWAAYSLNEMGSWGLSDTHIDYGRLLAAQFGIAVRWESQRNGGIDGLVHSPEPIAAGQGTWIEALGMFQQLSLIDERLSDETEALGDRLACGAGRMVAKQTRDTGDPRLDGAWFVDGVTRVDGQQHTLSGLLFAEQLLSERNEEGTE